MDVLKRLEAIEKEFGEELSACKDAGQAESMRVKYLGRKGELTGILRSVSGLSAEQKKEVGKKANILKNRFSDKIE